MFERQSSSARNYDIDDTCAGSDGHSVLASGDGTPRRFDYRGSGADYVRSRDANPSLTAAHADRVGTTERRAIGHRGADRRDHCSKRTLGRDSGLERGPERDRDRYRPGRDVRADQEPVII